MTQQYYTVLTNAGAAALANASALGQGISLTEFAVGDGGGATFNPDLVTLKTFSALTNELYRGTINELNVDPQNTTRYYAEGIVPLAVGGWTVREAGWFLSDGTLFAVTKFPPSYKSIPSDGVAVELPIRTYIAAGAADTVELKIDPTVILATRDYADRAHGYIPHSLDFNAQAYRGHRFSSENLTCTLPNTSELITGTTVRFDKAVQVSAGTIVPHNSVTTSIQAVATNGELHTDTSFIYSNQDPIVAILDENKNWEIKRGY